MIYFDTFTIDEIFAFSRLNTKRMFEPLFADSVYERDTRIELASHPWEGRILPLY